MLCKKLSKNNKGKYIFETHKNKIKYLQNNLIIKTVTNKEDFEEFSKIPWRIYNDDKYWIPPILVEIKDIFSINNPFWTHAESRLFLLYRNDEIVGRIAAIIDHMNCRSNNKNIGFFGFFECIQDFKCAEALLQGAQNWLASKGMKVMQGPINGRVDMGCGFLYHGFNSSPSLLSSYSPEYYISFAEKFHMKKTRDQHVYCIDLTKPLPKKLKEKADKCAASGVRIRRFNRLRTNKELKWWIDLFLETFKDHWGYVPVSAEEVKSRFGVKQLRWIVDSNLFLVAEINGEPVAYLWSTPDYNLILKTMNGQLNFFQMLKFLFKKKQIKNGNLHFIGVKKEVRKQNIGSYLNYEILVEMKKRGYVSAEVDWIDEENQAARKTIGITGAKPYKKFRVFEKNIQMT